MNTGNTDEKKDLPSTDHYLEFLSVFPVFICGSNKSCEFYLFPAAIFRRFRA